MLVGAVSLKKKVLLPSLPPRTFGIRLRLSPRERRRLPLARPERDLQLRFQFFFSSRRRHTISLRDWSSDVCASDLACVPTGINAGVGTSPCLVRNVPARA